MHLERLTKTTGHFNSKGDISILLSETNVIYKPWLKLSVLIRKSLNIKTRQMKFSNDFTSIKIHKLCLKYPK